MVASDLEPPELTEFSFAPTAVNISDGPQVITFTARFTDNLSGTDYPTEIRFSSPSGAHDIYPTFDAIDRISGEQTNGVFRETFTLPQYSETGVWTLSSITLADTAGNRVNHRGADALAYFAARDKGQA